MERMKLLEAYRVASDVCTRLRCQPRNQQQKEMHNSFLCSLLAQLRELLPSLSILHSFDSEKESSRVYVYESLSQTISQILALSSDGGCSSAQVNRPYDANGLGTEKREETPEGGSNKAFAGCLGSPQSPLRWSDIQGCTEAITALKQATMLPRRFPWLFDGKGRRPWQRILLYGPPGTGKTLLAMATAGELAGCPFLNLSSADVLSKWVGESEKHIRAAFAWAGRQERCLLFLDEMDALCGSRGAHGETEVARRLKTEFLFHLQTLPPSVVVMAATNLPWDIDSAILRRFDTFVYVGLPGLDTRHGLIAHQLGGVDHTLSKSEVEWIAKRTASYSSSDVVRVLSHAVMAPLRALVDATHLRVATTEEVAHHFRVAACTSLNAEGEGPLAAPGKPKKPKWERRTTAPAAAGRRATSAPAPSTIRDEAWECAASSRCFYVPCAAADPRALLTSFTVGTVDRASLLLPRVTMADVLGALKDFIPTVTSAQVQKYADWRHAQQGTQPT